MTVPNDSSPLLANDNERDGEVDAESLVKTEKAVTPLPKREMFVLCVMRFSEPVSYNLVRGRQKADGSWKLMGV